MSQGTNWRILVVEDKEIFRKQLLEAIPGFVNAPDTAEADLCENFGEALQKLQKDRYDVVILDLKDDSDGWELADDEPAGLKVFERLKQTRFVPVVFYTALAHKVRSLQTSFVRVVEKTETTERVKEEVRRVLATQLPALTRHLEEIQRSYMWEFVSTNWRDIEQSHHRVDLVYLLARRLAHFLRGDGIREFARCAHGAGAIPASSDGVHPIELYVIPPLGVRLAGDILVETVNSHRSYWLLLTPSCDFAQNKAEHVVLAKCEPLESQKEYADWLKNQSGAMKPLEALIGDNRTGKREVKTREEIPEVFKLQPERFKFLPGTFFMPDLVVDFQQLRSVPCAEATNFQPLASLDSPFAEAVLARFSRFFGRFGTPDIDRAIVLARLQASLKPNPPSPTAGS